MHFDCQRRGEYVSKEIVFENDETRQDSEAPSYCFAVPFCLVSLLSVYLSIYPICLLMSLPVFLQLKATFPGCTVKTLAVDFSQGTTEQLYATIETALKSLDVGILVNNVGLSYPHAMVKKSK